MKNPQPQRRANDARATVLGRLIKRWQAFRHEPDYEATLLAFTVLIIVLYQLYGER